MPYPALFNDHNYLYANPVTNVYVFCCYLDTAYEIQYLQLTYIAFHKILIYWGQKFSIND